MTDSDSAGHFEAVVRPGTFTLEVFPSFVPNVIGVSQTITVRSSMDLQITLPDIAP